MAPRIVPPLSPVLDVPTKVRRVANTRALPSQNKSLSDSVDASLSLQGIGFLTRKAIGLATVTLHVKQFTAPHKPPSTAEGDCVHIHIQQVATGGIKGTTENRCVDNENREHTDWLFGTVASRSFWCQAGADAILAAAGETGTAFLTTNWLTDDSEKTGPNGAAHLVSIAVNKDAAGGWTACQVWGFQTIGGERRYARNIVLKKGDKTIEMRLVYDFIPE